MKLLDAGDALEAHVLGDFHGVGAPGGNHLLAGPDEAALDGCGAQGGGSVKEPSELFSLLGGELVIRLYGVNQIRAFLKKYDHKCLAMSMNGL